MSEDADTESVRALLLGCVAGAVMRPETLVKIRGVAENYDDNGIIQSFTVTTESGRRYRLSVTFEGMEDEVVEMPPLETRSDWHTAGGEQDG